MNKKYLGAGVFLSLLCLLLIFIVIRPPEELKPVYELDKSITANIPEKPDNFDKMQVMIQYNYLKDLSKIGREYYMQPEWFPNYGLCVRAIMDRPINRFAGKGYMSYPAGVVTSARQGADITTYFWLRSGCTVSKLQGVMISPSYPPTNAIRFVGELPGGGKVVHQDPEKVKDYFDISVEPEVFLLGRTLPVMEENYTVKIEITVHVKDDVPEGNYIIAFNPDNPPQEYQDRWMWQYLTDYVNGGGITTSVPYYSFFINVVGKEKILSE